MTRDKILGDAGKLLRCDSPGRVEMCHNAVEVGMGQRLHLVADIAGNSLRQRLETFLFSPQMRLMPGNGNSQCRNETEQSKRNPLPPARAGVHR